MLPVRPLAIPAAVLALVLAGCDGGGDRAETTFRKMPEPQQDYWQVEEGVGGRPAQERGMGDPYRYAFAGLPETAPLKPEATVLFNTGYVTGYDHARRQPMWTCYRVFAGAESPKDKDAKGSATDPRVPAPAAPQGKEKAPALRQLAPRAPIAACYGDEAGDETRLHSNLAPVAGDGGWDQLTGLERAYADAYQELWVTAGVLPEGQGWWKVHVTVQDGQPRAQAFFFPATVPEEQRRNGVDLASRMVSIEELEARTGLTLFATYRDLGDDTRTLFVTSVAEGLWPTGADATAARSSR